MAFAIGIGSCVGLLVGVLGGFALAKKAGQWCPACGVTLTPAHCPHVTVDSRPERIVKARSGRSR